jgi:hypothetical protein
VRKHYNRKVKRVKSWSLGGVPSDKIEIELKPKVAKTNKWSLRPAPNDRLELEYLGNN